MPNTCPTCGQEVGDEAHTCGGVPLLSHINDMPHALKRIGELEAENAKLREIVSKIAASIGNGATCSPNCTLDFMESVAEEVRLVTTKLRDRVAELEKFAKAHEAWEAKLIVSDEAWGGGMDPLPRFTSELWDEALELQKLRNAALRGGGGK